MAERPLIFGEVLFDRFPDGSSVLGGAPFNVAWNLRAFGLDPLLVSRVGRDAAGERIRAAMEDWGLATAGLQVDPARPTGQVTVTLQEDEPRFEIGADQAWDHIAPVAPAESPPLIYHGSLATRQPVSAASLAALRSGCPAPVFVDVNLRDPWWDPAGIANLLQGARWIKLNRDELDRLEPGKAAPGERAERLRRRTGSDQIILTGGSEGAWLVAADRPPLAVSPAERVETVDSVGAGDAFASVMLLGQLRGWPPEATLRRAQQFAAALVTVRGATLSDRSFYQAFLDHWRSDEQPDH